MYKTVVRLNTFVETEIQNFNSLVNRKSKRTFRSNVDRVWKEKPHS